ncbi:POK9 protein, partial [Mionectes macconnelli]|nr:POK9 protein [Mionectes macconnelli]
TGSLGYDLATAVDVTLYNTDTHAIPTGIKSPIRINGQAIGGIILGRSSATLQGLRVDPGVLDPDSEGDIFILARTDFPPLTIPKGEKIAQLVPISPVPSAPLSSQPRKQGQLGSTGLISLLVLDLSERPRRRCTITWQDHSITLTKALLDTGADSCIID